MPKKNTFYYRLNLFSVQFCPLIHPKFLLKRDHYTLFVHIVHLKYTLFMYTLFLAIYSLSVCHLYIHLLCFSASNPFPSFFVKDFFRFFLYFFFFSFYPFSCLPKCLEIIPAPGGGIRNFVHPCSILI